MTLSTRARAGGFLVQDEPLRSRAEVVVLHGQVLSPGHVVGRTLVSATATPVAKVGNTGTGSIGTVTPGTGALDGRYTVTIIEPGSNAGVFEVQAPDGREVTGTVAVAFSALGIGFTLADATDFIAGDQIYIDVTLGTEKLKEYDPANTDGSQFPYGIVWDYADATAADVKATAVLNDAAVNSAELVWFSGATADQIALATQQLRDQRRIRVATAI